MKYTLFVIYVQLVFSLTDSSAQNNEVNKNEPKSISQGYQISGDKMANNEAQSEWYHKFPLLPIAIATSKTIPEGECKNQLQHYVKDLQRGKMWAMELFDSSVKFPSGILEGQTTSFGNFDQCYGLNVQLPNETNGSFTSINGKYCLVDFQYEKKNFHPKFYKELSIYFDPSDSVWEAIVERGDFRRVKRYLLQLGVCVPSACTAKDVETALNNVFNEFDEKHNLSINVSVNPRNCQAYHETPDFSISAKIYCTLAAVLIGLVTIATIFDSNRSNENAEKSSSTLMEALLCFSARRNVQSIFEVNYNHRALDCTHMLRFVYTFLVVAGHRGTHLYLLPTMNKRNFSEVGLNHPFYVVLHIGTIIVDIFIAMSGLLTCYGLLEELDKTKRFNFVKFVLIRFLRYTPAYAFIIFGYITIFPYIGSGPLWQQKVGVESERCRNHWWKNLLFINNFVKVDEKCMFQSWSLSSDFQMYIMGLFLIYVFWKLPRLIGYLYLILLLVISFVISFYVTYVNNTQATFIQYPYLNDLIEDHYLITYYMKPYMHLSPYFIGVITGAVIYHTNSVTWRIPKILSRLLLPICFAIRSLAVVPGKKFFDPNISTSLFEKAFYASYHRATYIGSICLLLILVQLGSGLDFYNKVMTAGWVQSFARLSFGIYLTHGFIQLYSMGARKTPKTGSFYYWTTESIVDYILAYAAALIISICIEGPFRRIEKLFIRNSRKKTLNDKSQEEMSVKKIN